MTTYRIPLRMRLLRDQRRVGRQAVLARLAARRGRRRRRPRRVHRLRPPGERRPRQGRAALHPEVRHLPRPDRRRHQPPPSGRTWTPPSRRRGRAGWTRTRSRAWSSPRSRTRGPLARSRPTSTCRRTWSRVTTPRTSPPTSPASPASPGSSRPSSSPPEFFATNCGGCHTLSQAGTTGHRRPQPRPGAPGQSPAADLAGHHRPERADRPRLPRRRDAPELRHHPDPPSSSSSWSSS